MSNLHDFNFYLKPADTVVFDLDDTLMKPNKKIDKLTMYLEISHQRWIPEAKRMFDKVTKTHEIFILTNRHPILRDEIAMKLNMEPLFVHCRTYSLSTMQMKKAMHDPIYEQKFLDYMIVEKTAWLNTLRGYTVYVDDMAHRFDLRALNKSIVVFNQDFELLGRGEL